MTKEERAKEWANEQAPWTTIYESGRMYDYLQGLKDQEPVTRKELTDQVCELLITALNEGLLETNDIGKLNMWIRKQLAKNANSKNN